MRSWCGSLILTTCRSYIPVGTTINPSFYAMHRDPRNFAPRTNEFWPERWLVAAGTETNAAEKDTFVHNVNAFVPFSYGPANCVGKALGMQEMRTVLCSLLQRVQMRLAPGFEAAEYEGRMQEWLIITKPPLPVQLELREGRR